MHSVPATAQASIPIKIMMMPNATDFLHKATTAQATEATPQQNPGCAQHGSGNKPQAGSRCDPGQ